MYSKRQYNAFSALSQPTRPREKRAASAESPFDGALPYMVPVTDEVRASIIIAIIVRKYSVRQLFFTTFSQNPWLGSAHSGRNGYIFPIFPIYTYINKPPGCKEVVSYLFYRLRLPQPLKGLRNDC